MSTVRRMTFIVIASALFAVLAPPVALATAPSNANIAFKVQSTVTILNRTVNGDLTSVPGYVYWSAGSSSTAGVSCCTYDIYTTLQGQLVGTTTKTQWPIVLSECCPFNYNIEAHDANGAFVGSTQTDPPSSQDNQYYYLADDAGSCCFTYSNGWSAALNSENIDGSSHTTTTSGASVSFQAYKAVAWVTTTGPDRGSAKIYVDGTYLKTVSTYSAVKHYRRVVWAKTWGPMFPVHTITIVNSATSGHPRIDFDANLNLSTD